MENPNGKAASDATTGTGAEGNPSNDAPRVGDGEDNRRRRTPFTDLSQVDADLALARTLQEQERAYMMLRMNSGIGSDYESWEAESYGNEDVFDNDDFEDASGEDYDGSDVEVDDETENAFGVHAPEAGDESGNENAELDPSAFSSDEAYARALQDAEERELADRLLALAGINNMVAEDEDEDEDVDEEEEEHDGNLQDTWEEVDPDELSYEELIALGDVVGTESRGLSEDTIASLPSIKYQSQGIHEGSDSCVICRLDYEDGDTLTILSCKHSYHKECINNWLQINKVCPVCSAEVSTPGRARCRVSRRARGSPCKSRKEYAGCWGSTACMHNGTGLYSRTLVALSCALAVRIPADLFRCELTRSIPPSPSSPFLPEIRRPLVFSGETELKLAPACPLPAAEPHHRTHNSKAAGKTSTSTRCSTECAFQAQSQFLSRANPQLELHLPVTTSGDPSSCDDQLRDLPPASSSSTSTSSPSIPARTIILNSSQRFTAHRYGELAFIRPAPRFPSSRHQLRRS
ncbi:E3 ubiquitin ligase BIG BROTHER-related [Striga hermonthica]|uniref:E3 ubiquitin ligase BIG BROTHER-related n=1 Tax=Striga hermonthica TaxID=68872 RepID=A0A9N7R3V6_STRHE|nr:E3 ubiquitin ligase BIG BROTHER-related [Striga hermonthica]